MKIIIFLLTLTLSGIVSAEKVSMTCSGKYYDQFRSFDITVNAQTGEMWGFPNWVAMGCARLNNNDVINDKNSITENSASQTCKNTIWMSILTLSRSTGNLNVITADIKKEKIESDQTYNCKKVIKKVF